MTSVDEFYLPITRASIHSCLPASPHFWRVPISCPVEAEEAECACVCSRHRLNSGGSVSRMSQLQSRFTSSGRAGAGGTAVGTTPHDSYVVSPYHNQLTSLAAAAAAATANSGDTPPPTLVSVRPTSVLPLPTRPVEPTHFHWNTSSRRKQRQLNMQQTSDGTTTSDFKPRLNCTVSHYDTFTSFILSRLQLISTEI